MVTRAFHRHRELLNVQVLQYLKEKGPSPITYISHSSEMTHRQIQGIISDLLITNLIVRENLDDALLTEEQYVRLREGHHQGRIGFVYSITKKGVQLLTLYENIGKLLPGVC